MTWDLELGQQDERTAIQARHAGSHSRGISAPGRATGKHNIMLWWRPEAGGAFGYSDGWTHNGDAFYYSGTGQVGDQTFDAPHPENGRVRDHAATSDQIRLLRYLSTNQVRYVGELRLDPADPWRWVDGRDRHQETRRIIQFRFLPVGKVLIESVDPVHEPPAQAALIEEPMTEALAPTETEVEALESEVFKQLCEVRERLVRRTELRLVHDFRDWLSTVHQLKATGLRIPYSAESRNLRADLYLAGPNVLIEAKSNSSREKIRLAIGQLLDYQRWLEPAPHLLLLTPDRPASDMCLLLEQLGISWACRSRQSGFEIVGLSSAMFSPLAGPTDTR